MPTPYRQHNHQQKISQTTLYLEHCAKLYAQEKTNILHWRRALKASDFEAAIITCRQKIKAELHFFKI